MDIYASRVLARGKEREKGNDHLPHTPAACLGSFQGKEIILVSPVIKWHKPALGNAVNLGL